jgi:predicted Zn finger-like uncharacterized protein
MAVIQCPDCGKSLKVNDSTLGKRVRCPGCKNPFVVPDAPVVELAEEDEEQEERVTTRPRRPAARREREEEDEEDDEPRRPRRKRVRNEDDVGVSFSSTPLIFGILSILLSCSLVIGFYFGMKALNEANAELDRLPGGKRARAARKQLQVAKTLGVIGMCLSGVGFVVAVIWRIVEARK